MTVHVKLFAVARERAGRDTLAVELPEDATVAHLARAVADAAPELASILPHALWAVDAAYAAETTPLTPQSDVALIPPVSGG